MANKELTPPTIDDVLAARALLAGRLRPTALTRYPLLDELAGCELHVKHENHQPIGAFKVRGGLNLVGRLSPAERARGLVTASTGNHGQSIAWAAREEGVAATVVAPEGANPAKVASMRALGARVVLVGADFDEAREEAERLATREGLRYVHSANEPLLIAGVATYAVEIVEELPELDVLIVPVGGGSGASGAGLVLHALASRARLIAVQAARAPAVWRSWREGRIVECPQSTLAEGLATRTAFDLTLRMLREHVDEFVLVEDEAMLDAVRAYIERTRNLVEPSGAASLAAALLLREELRGQRVAVVASGANISLDQLRAALAR